MCEDEDDSPHQMMSISLSASEVETAVLEGMQLGEMAAKLANNHAAQPVPTKGRTRTMEVPTKRNVKEGETADRISPGNRRDGILPS